MKFTFSILLFLFFKTYSFCQVSQFNGFRDYRVLADTYYMSVMRGDEKINVSDINGTPFLKKEFSYGFVLDTVSQTKAYTNLRYDVYNDLFEIKLEPSSKSLKTIVRSPQFQYFLNDEKFVLIQTDVLNKNQYISGNGYVVELTTSKLEVVLYKRYTKKFIPGKDAKSSYGTSMPPRITEETNFIIKFEDKFVLAEPHKRKILDAFPNHEKKLKKYIKDKGFKFRGSDREIQNEMIQVVRYYNSLNN